MSKNYEVQYSYDHGNSLFIIYYNGESFVGTAHCHDEDKDMESERTGLTIAEARAHIKMMKFIKKYEIEPKVDVLRHLVNNIQSSKHHNPRAYESCMLRSQYAYWVEQLAEINTDIADEERSLQDYIKQKDKLYQKLRARNQ